MIKLYPLKFKAIYKDYIWGGMRLSNEFGKGEAKNQKIAESWEVSAVGQDVSIINNGELSGKSLNEIITMYGIDLLGKHIWEKYGAAFPLLVKFIDAATPLSVQVHPNDQMAAKIHSAKYGKNEIWYIMDAAPEAELVLGFNQKINQDQYIAAVDNHKISEILGIIPVHKGDLFPISAGTIHSIGAGNLIVEIQQSCDYTYRIYDWDRLDDQGQPRELHQDLALQAIDFSPTGPNFALSLQNSNTSETNTKYNQYPKNDPKSPHLDLDLGSNPTQSLFNFKKIKLNSTQSIKLDSRDSFSIYICISGAVEITDITQASTKISLKTGETCLIPAEIKEIIINNLNNEAELIETYM